MRALTSTITSRERGQGVSPTRRRHLRRREGGGGQDGGGESIEELDVSQGEEAGVLRC